MRLQLEEIREEDDRSLKIMVNPNLSDFFFWHFHPQLELVYIEGADGTRHVGDHIAAFKHSDLVLIGSNIPHLNFDYGIKTPYQKIVVHMTPKILDHGWGNLPEFKPVEQLLADSVYGLAFSKPLHVQVADTLKNLNQQKPFQQMLSVMEVLQTLSSDADLQRLHTKPVVNPNSIKEQRRIKQVYAYIEEHFHHKIELQDVADLCCLSKEAFCRYFKKMTRLTFTAFVNHYRIDHAKRLLMQGQSVTQAAFNSGFESLAYFNRIFKRVTGLNPLSFKQRHLQQSIDQVVVL